MSESPPLKFTVKSYAIATLQIAECNLLNAIKGVTPEQAIERIHPEINHIAWIVGHCTNQLDFMLALWSQSERTFTEEIRKYFAHGAPKDKILEGLPISYIEVVNIFLELSEKFNAFLEKLPPEKFHEYPNEKMKESLLQMIQRIALHYSGHMGQFVIIRRALGNPGASFVTGIHPKDRVNLRNDFLDWWQGQEK